MGEAFRRYRHWPRQLRPVIVALKLTIHLGVPAVSSSKEATRSGATRSSPPCWRTLALADPSPGTILSSPLARGGPCHHRIQTSSIDSGQLHHRLFRIYIYDEALLFRFRLRFGSLRFRHGAISSPTAWTQALRFLTPVSLLYLSPRLRT